MRRPWFAVSTVIVLASCRDNPVQPALRPLAQATAFASATLVVDDDGMASAGNCGSAAPAYTSIQAAVNAAAAGDLVLVCPGSYDELVSVTTDQLTIRAAGAGAVLRPSAVPINTTLLSGANARAILLIDGANGVAVEGLTIDGGVADAGRSLEVCGGGRPFYLGLFLRGGSGQVESMHVTNMQSASGCSFGVFAQSILGVPADLAVTGSAFDHYGSGAVVCTGPDASCTITGNTVRGLGPVDDQLQSGIAIRFGAVAQIAGNVITDHWFNPHRLPGPEGGIAARSIGIFMFAPDPATNPHLMERNSFDRNEMNVQRLLTEEVVF